MVQPRLLANYNASVIIIFHACFDLCTSTLQPFGQTPVYFNPLAKHASLDAELQCLHEHFTAKYEESLVLHAIVLSLYDMSYD